MKTLKDGLPDDIPDTDEENYNWRDTAAMYARNADFYRGLLDQCAQHLGPEAYTADDGVVHQDPIRLKIPELVGELVRTQTADA